MQATKTHSPEHFARIYQHRVFYHHFSPFRHIQLCFPCRPFSFSRNEKETLETPPLTCVPGKFSRIHFVARKKSKALLLCSSIPVATGKIFGSKMISFFGKPT